MSAGKQIGQPATNDFVVIDQENRNHYESFLPARRGIEMLPSFIIAPFHRCWRLTISNEQSASCSDGVAGGPEQLSQMLTVVGPDNHQLHRSLVISQVIRQGAMCRERLHP